MPLTLKEYAAVGIVIAFLVVLSETKIQIGAEKFHQLTCAGHLRNLYQAIDLCMRENPSTFADHKDEQWFMLLPRLDRKYLRCPKEMKNARDKDRSALCDYALDKSVYDHFINDRTFTEKNDRKILLLDCVYDPAGFNMFPMASPAFRHNDGCNILLANGVVIWCSKDDFSSDNL